MARPSLLPMAALASCLVACPALRPAPHVKPMYSNFESEDVCVRHVWSTSVQFDCSCNSFTASFDALKSDDEAHHHHRHHHHHHHLPPPDADTLLLLPGGVPLRQRSSAPPLPLPLVGAVPAPFAVQLGNGSLLRRYMESNIDYLLHSFTVDHMLVPFRSRPGSPCNDVAEPPPAGPRAQQKFWDTDLKGSNAGRFLMGAGNTLRWVEHTELRRMVDELVSGIMNCSELQFSGEGPGRYSLPFAPPGFLHSEQGDYGRSWLTQGLIEAGKAGNPQAFPLIRGLMDWFNAPDLNIYLPYLYGGISNGEQGQIASSRVYLETPGRCHRGKCTPVYADVQTAQDAYRDDLWMRQLIAREPSAIYDYHMPAPNHPHCYELTSFMSWFDHFRATHNSTYLDAATGAWDVLTANFLHVDGSSSLTEGRRFTNPTTGRKTDWPPKSYKLGAKAFTGETCCTVFWIKFNQRFALRSPEEEKYSAAIELSLFNALLRQLGFRSSNAAAGLCTSDPKKGCDGWGGCASDPKSGCHPGLRGMAPLQGTKGQTSNINTCCEAQGSRAFGSIPEYIFTTVAAVGPAPPLVYVNLFVGSTLDVNATVVEGVAQYPLRRNATPRAGLPPMPPVVPPPPMRFVKLAVDGFYPLTGDPHQPPVRAATLTLFESVSPLTSFRVVDRSPSNLSVDSCESLCVAALLCSCVACATTRRRARCQMQSAPLM